MKKVSAILKRKQPHFLKISPTCTANDALCRMNTHDTDYLIVMDDDDHFLGLLTEHDIVAKTLFSKRPVSTIQANEMINTNLPVVNKDSTIDQCMQLMWRHHVRYLAVFNELDFLGIISSNDILREAVRNRNAIFDEEKVA
jgi:CBS domain-containing protein